MVELAQPPAGRSHMREARAFTAAVHAAQKRDGLRLSQHEFVKSVRAGSASREELGQWVRQIYCTTRAYGATLLSLSSPPPVGVWIDPWLDLELLLELGGALGISPRELRSCEPNLVARGVQLWLRHHLTDPCRHVAGQISWAMVEAMSPDTGASLAEGASRYFGLKEWQLGYFRIGMKSRRRADHYAATLLSHIAVEEWPSIEVQSLLVSRVMAQLYDSVGCSPWTQRKNREWVMTSCRSGRSPAAVMR